MKELDEKNRRILIIDDEKDIQELLKTVFMKEGYTEVYGADTGVSGIEICRKIDPDIMILDVMLPDITGYEVCKRIREFSYAPIIFLSARAEDTDKIAGFDIGGDDYVTKPFSPKELVCRVNAHFRRNEYIDKGNKKEEIIKIDNLIIDEDKMEVQKNGIPVNLTAREYQLLCYMARHPNQILSKQKLCDKVWGDEYVGYDNTIMVHIRHLREKVEDDPANPKYIKNVKGLGYRFNI